MFLGSPFCW